MNVELESLIKKLNSVCFNAIQKAAELCVSNTNYNVELEHLVFRLIEQTDTDFSIILRHYEINVEKLTRQC